MTADRLQQKREIVILLRERDHRAEKDPDEMLESELDSEIEWRKNPDQFKTDNSIIKDIYKILSKIQSDLKPSKKAQQEQEIEESVKITESGNNVHD